MAKKIITSALPYVNNQPHLGNIIGCVLSGDIYARFCKKNNEEVVYICGTDEYGTAIEMAAFAQNKTPLQICEENRIIHKNIYDWFDINFDCFGCTTSNLHTEKVQEFFKKIYKNGFFDENIIEQFFCESCQIFLADRYVVGTCKFCKYTDAKGDQCDGCGHTYKSLDLIDAKCTLCSSVPSIKETKHLFFNLNVFKNQLTDLYEKNGKYWSQNGKHITKGWLNQELLPRCMTRDLKNKWGVQVPLEGFENKVFYVWFDAVIGYFTFLKELTKDKYEEWLKDGELVQFMGKDNVFFHTIIFPAMIFATKDEYPVVKQLSVTEYLLFENQKFSKSRGHGIFGLDLVDNSLGNSCLWRYYLAKIRPEKFDSNFSFYHFCHTIDADLNNNIGNFCNRVLKFIKNKCKGKVSLSLIKEEDNQMKESVNKIYKNYLQNFKEIKLRDALERVLEISKIGNEFVQQAVLNKSKIENGFVQQAVSNKEKIENGFVQQAVSNKEKIGNGFVQQAVLNKSKIENGFVQQAVSNKSKIENGFVQQAVSNKENMVHGFLIAFSIVALIGQLLDPFIPVSSDKLLKMCNMKKENYDKEFSIIKEWQISDDIFPLFNKLDPSILKKFETFKK